MHPPARICCIHHRAHAHLAGRLLVDQGVLDQHAIPGRSTRSRTATRRNMRASGLGRRWPNRPCPRPTTRHRTVLDAQQVASPNARSRVARWSIPACAPAAGAPPRSRAGGRSHAVPGPAGDACHAGSARLHAVVAHQAEQRGPIAKEMVPAQPVGLGGIDARLALHTRPWPGSGRRTHGHRRRAACCRDRTATPGAGSGTGQRAVLRAVIDRASEDKRIVHVSATGSSCRKPWSVRISSSIAWGTRPSMMCTALTPLLAASSAPLILGSMPPRWCRRRTARRSRAPTGWSAACRLVQHAGRVGQQHQLLALSTSASLLATRSALML